MCNLSMVKIEVNLTEDEAWELAQFIKRTTWEDFLRRSAPGDIRAERMRDGCDKLQVALAGAGINPR